MTFSIYLNEEMTKKLNLKEGEKKSKRIMEIISRYHDITTGYTTGEKVIELEKLEKRQPS